MPQTRSTAMDRIQQLAIRIRKHQWRLYAVGLLAVLATSGLFFFKRYQHQQSALAQREMFQAVYYFEQEAFDKALHGDGVYVGLLDIVKTYRFTKAANLAHFYIGVSYLHQKVYDKAIQHLTKFRSKDGLLPARAWALIGDAYAEQKDYTAAADYYLKAANYKPNKAFTPSYLVKAALAYEANENRNAALGCYQRIVQKFPDVPQYGAAVKHVARLETLSKQPQQSPGH